MAAVLTTTTALLLLAHEGFPGWSIFLRALSVVLCSQVCVGALNDFLDRNADSLWQPDKPIPAGEVSSGTALLLSTGAGLLMIPLAFSFGPVSGIIAEIGLLGGISYNLGVKKVPWSFASYQIGFLSLVTWIWHLAGHLTPGLLALYPGAALLIFAAHVAQSLPDVETDRAQGVHGVASVLGVDRAVRATALASLLPALAASLLGLVSGTFGAAGLGVLASTGTLLALSIPSARPTRTRLTLFFRAIVPCIMLTAVAAILAARGAAWI